MTRAPEIGFALQRGFAAVCHQQADRSFLLFGGSAAACARCLGIYLGAALGLLVRVPRQFATRLLAIAVAFNLLDWLAEFSGLHGNLIGLRFALGVGLGLTGAMLVIASAYEFRTSTARGVART
jgi:uncharacterized membrane protein